MKILSKWTPETLQKFLEARIDANEALALERFESGKTALAAALSSAKELVTQAQIAATNAVEKANAASDKRFESVNEFRGLVEDNNRQFIPRMEVEKGFSAVDERLKKMEARDIEFRGHHKGVGDGWGWAVGAVMFVITIATIAASVWNVTR